MLTDAKELAVEQSKSNRATSAPYRRSIGLDVLFSPFREVTPCTAPFIVVPTVRRTLGAGSSILNGLGTFPHSRFDTVLESCGKVLWVVPIDGVVLPNVEVKILHVVLPASPDHLMA